MSEQVRHLVGLENTLLKARRRHHECEREQGPKGAATQRYARMVERLSEEIHGADRQQLEEYLFYVETDLLPRIARKAETTKTDMVQAALHIVDGRHDLMELRRELTDALERVRSVRERLDMDPFPKPEAKFGLGAHPPNADRRVRDAHSLVKDFLKT
ncbi:MAG: hypothetical protein ACYTGN_09475 [Planctomycetota bacterium]|jgi:hypothetical protein